MHFPDWFEEDLNQDHCKVLFTECVLFPYLVLRGLLKVVGQTEVRIG